MTQARLTSVFATGRLDQMAVARLQGSITWAEEIRLRSGSVEAGIRLFDSAAAAAAHQIPLTGYPVIVVEIPVATIDLDQLTRVDAPEHEHREWHYPLAIEFEQVRWHRYSQEATSLTQQAVFDVRITAETQPAAANPYKGTITLDRT